MQSAYQCYKLQESNDFWFNGFIQDGIRIYWFNGDHKRTVVKFT